MKRPRFERHRRINVTMFLTRERERKTENEKKAFLTFTFTIRGLTMKQTEERLNQKRQERRRGARDWYKFRYIIAKTGKSLAAKPTSERY